jgi:hypothetical protein
MKTLVIHPEDSTTTFLSKIYEGQDWTIETRHRGSGYHRKEFIQQVKEHDRIIMMGHGYPGGLFMSYVNPEAVYLLREKDCICIWCNADQFVQRYKLTGFFTGMFISEVGEANYYQIHATQEQVDISNNMFADLVSQTITEQCATIHRTVKDRYYTTCPIVKFNNDRLYYQDEETILAMKDLDYELKTLKS